MESNILFVMVPWSNQLKFAINRNNMQEDTEIFESTDHNYLLASTFKMLLYGIYINSANDETSRRQWDTTPTHPPPSLPRRDTLWWVPGPHVDVPSRSASMNRILPTTFLQQRCSLFVVPTPTSLPWRRHCMSLFL